MDKNKAFDMAQAVSKISSLNNSFNCVASAFPENPTVTMAYIPYQLDRTAFTPEEALQKGTLFKCLNKEFFGRSVENE